MNTRISRWTPESPYPAGGEIPGKYYRTLDPFRMLAVAASVTERILLGTAVVLISERDPIITAKEVASTRPGQRWPGRARRRGRLEPGGDGQPRHRPQDPGPWPVTERLKAIRARWADEQAEFHGEFVGFDPVFSWPKPVRKPHPPIYIGGGAAGVDRIAEVGDGWLALPFHDVGPMLEQLREKAGWDVPVTVLDIEHNPGKLTELAELGAQRVLLELPTMPEAESLHKLDRCAKLIAGIN